MGTSSCSQKKKNKFNQQENQMIYFFAFEEAVLVELSFGFVF